jgi:hypothetical protein
MSRARRLLLLAAATAAFAGVVVAAGALVALRYRSVDPAVVTASSGMYAFGDSVLFLAVIGAMSLPAGWLVLRALRDLDGFWRAISWAGLSWAALAPASVAIRAVSTAAPGAAAPLQLAEALAIVRLFASPASLPGLVLAAWSCRHPPSTRRLRWAVALDGAGLAALALWLGWTLLRARALR